MRRFATAFLLGSLAAQDPPPADYVVHEWRTFTSMAGSQGC